MNKTVLDSLERAPRLRSLYSLLIELEQENPFTLLVADTPFFVHDDGTPYLGANVNPRLVPSHTYCSESGLKCEIEAIACRIRKGECPAEDLEKFESWAVPQMRHIKDARRAVDRSIVRDLKRRNLLN